MGVHFLDPWIPLEDPQNFNVNDTDHLLNCLAPLVIEVHDNAWTLT